MSNMPKYVLAIDHLSEYKDAFSYYALKSNTKALALAEAALRVAKAEKVARANSRVGIRVTSGVAARRYYESLGFSKDLPYMSKLF